MLEVQGQLRLGARTLGVTLVGRARRIGLVGPSGIGKSTLLRGIAGVAPLARVVVRGEIWDGPGVHVPPWKRGAGWVPQDASLFPHRSVRENLAWASPNADVTAVADALGLHDLLDRAPRHLSGGERQRVAVGRALLAARTLLLLDEPWSALDRARRDDVSRFVDDWATARDLPVLLVSHDARDLERTTDEVHELTEGGLVRV